jgi:hypothetical protein
MQHLSFGAFRMTPDWVELDLASLRHAPPFQEVRPGLYAYFQPASSSLPPCWRCWQKGCPPLSILVTL